MKITAIILIWSVCCLIGFYKTYKLKKRRDELDSFITAIKKFSTAVAYERLPPASFFSEQLIGNSVDEINIKSIDPMHSFCQIDKTQTTLNESDLSVLSAFFEAVGKSDLNSQLALVKNTISELEKNRSEAANIYNNYAKLYATSGFLIGTLFVILLI